jgi:hypothetical protein
MPRLSPAFSHEAVHVENEEAGTTVNQVRRLLISTFSFVAYDSEPTTLTRYKHIFPPNPVLQLALFLSTSNYPPLP